MAPTPQEFGAGAGAGAEAGAEAGERVVVSGMSGLFPGAHHVKDLADVLYNKKNPILSENLRWTYEHPEVPRFVGTVPDLELFDAQFFKVHYRQGNSMDSMSRKILEQAYQAIYDAGVCPDQLRGKKIAVFVGSCFSETEKACFYVATIRTGFGISGCNKAMFANRISYWLNAKGPSMAIDDACCSSAAAVEQAYHAITRGECEAAIVGGAHLCLHPQSSIHCSRVMQLSKDGLTRSFDEHAAGCAKSEAINVLFLQKAKDARRVYAEVVHVKTEFTGVLEGEMGPRYGFYRDPLSVANFLKTFYDEARISTRDVEYMDAFGSATPEADKNELDAISDVFCRDRREPLLIGSVMSNIGYAEAATGINSIIKVLLGYHTGELAGTMNCTAPRRDVWALRDGRMRVVTEHTRFRRDYAAVNGLSVTGVNAHVLLHGRYKPKDLSRYKSNIPHLVTVSGRQESSVKNILSDLKSRPIDPEELALFHNIHEHSISGHLGRGFIILDTDEEHKTVGLCEKAEYFDDVKRPLWFVYSGMGSQWAGMGAHLMRIPVFAAAIERCRRVLEPRGVDIVDIITSPDKRIFDNILNSFVGIAAIQIGLTDILREMGLVPDKIIGHSVGELGCAYADGCFTAEEMILSAYSRGLVSVQTPFIRGSMAAVGVGFEEISQMCPPEIEVACHNGPDSSTISGPADVMREFVAQLTAQNIFAKEVPCSNIAYHSRYIAEAGPKLLEYLSEVIQTPKRRSERWVSTSVPRARWDQPAAQYSSPEYHTNNLLNPVLFEESSRLVDDNAVVVEVAPHGLLQAILKRSLPAGCRNVPLTRRAHPDNARMVLEAIGQLYMLGYYPRVQALYPKIEFPVSTGTPMLSHLVDWAHHEKWVLPLYVSAHRKTAAASNFVLSTHDDENRYLQGNVIKGKTLYPFSAALVAVWDTLAMSRDLQRGELAVQFRDVVLHAQPVLHDRRQLRLSIALHRGTGRFEVMDDQSKVASGYITSEPDNERTLPTTFNAKEELDQNTIYQILSMRDFAYQDEFRSIYSANESFTEARIFWRNNWVTLIDGMLQLHMLRHPHATVSRPNFIRKICISLKDHKENEADKIGNEFVKVVNVSPDGNRIRCHGVVIEDIRLHNLPIASDDDNIISLKALKFIPHYQSEKTDINTVMHIGLQIVAENINKNVVNILEIVDNDIDSSKFTDVESIISGVPGIVGVYKRLERNKILEERDNFLSDVNLLLVSSLRADELLCQTLYRVLPRNTFLINKEDGTQKSAAIRPSALYRVVCSHALSSGYVDLALWRPTAAAAPSGAIGVHSASDLDLLSATQASLLPHQKLLVLTPYPPIQGLKDLVKHWRKEYDRKIHVAMINHKISEDQNLDQMPNLDLAFNVLDHGVWGGEYYVPLQKNTTQLENVTLQCARLGDLNSLEWVQAPMTSESGVKVTVHYAGVNDLDVKRATGLIPFDGTAEGGEGFAMDFSGVTESGERVMGIVAQGAMSSVLRVDPERLWPVPEHWSLEEAATVPLAYCLAYYCLGLKRELQPGMSVLVQGGAGALGQAVVSLALAQRCNVFVAVSSVAKKQFLLSVFPDLKAENVSNSRDQTFVDMVRHATGGVGVDIVISCAKGNMKNVSLKCSGRLCIFYDVVQILSHENYEYGMSHMSGENSYVRVDLPSILKGSNGEMKRLQRMLCEGIARGWVRPLSRVAFGPRDAPRAFRLLAGARARGRVLLRLQDARDAFPAHARIQCSPDLHHVILCHDDLLTLHLADKLVSQGARKLLLRKFDQIHNFEFLFRKWQSKGVEIIEAAEELTTNKSILSAPNKSGILASIEGIYVILTDREKSAEFSSILSNLDSLSRQAHLPLKYFAVASSDDSFGSQICISRLQDRLPATLIKLPSIYKMDGGNNVPSGSEGISARQAIAVMEQALCSSEGVVLAHITSNPGPSFLSRVAALTDIHIPEDVEDTCTLSELGLDVEKLNALHVYLRDAYNVSLPEETIPKITIQKLREIEQTLSCDEFENVEGLQTYISYVDSDELSATIEMVVMPTFASGQGMRGDEFDVNQTYLCIVPGVEGHHARFRMLCERLKLPALVLQPGLHRPEESPRELATRYAEILLEKTSLKRNFYLLGYESGVLVALELAALLEERGLEGTVFCVGAPPAEFGAELARQLRGLEGEEALQDAVVRHMFALMAGEGAGELEAALRGAASWREKVEAAVRTLLGRVSHSAQYARQLMEAARGRLAALRAAAVEPRALRSRLVLLRPAPAPALAAALQPHSRRPAHAHALRAPLASAATDLRVAAIVNSYLEDDILKAFWTKNLCESYLVNENSFMTAI